MSSRRRRVASADESAESIDRSTLAELADLHGGGFEGLYRRRARDVEAVFESSEAAASSRGDDQTATIAVLHDELVAQTEPKIAVLHELLGLPS